MSMKFQLDQDSKGVSIVLFLAEEKLIDIYNSYAIQFMEVMIYF